MIEKISLKNIHDINKPNHPFCVIGKIIPVFQNGMWSFTECIFEKPYEKYYPNDDEEYNTYIDNSEKTVFFCYDDINCIGQIRLRKYWNNYAFIEDIAVSQNNRGKGIGTQLIKKAVEWAKSKNLIGLMLETQDNNLLACRFYSKIGFQIGAVDTMLYTDFDNADEKAVFWYMKF